MYKQLVHPNLNQAGRPYWCLEFVFNAYGGMNGEGNGYAREAWDNNRAKHVGVRPPLGVAVPIWFDLTLDLGDGAFNYGDVAIQLADGRVLSAPTEWDYQHGRPNSVWSSLDQYQSVLYGTGVRYLGWTEYMDGTQLVEHVPATDLSVVADEVIAGMWGNDPQRSAALTAAGYDAAAVQAVVNQKLYGGVAATHTVQSGESLSGIASKYGQTWQDLYARNRQVVGDNPNLIYAGQVLVL